MTTTAPAPGSPGAEAWAGMVTPRRLATPGRLLYPSCLTSPGIPGAVRVPAPGLGGDSTGLAGLSTSGALEVPLRPV